MTSSRVLTRSGLFLAVLLVSSLAFADQKSDLYAKGQAAVNAGDAVAARDAFCALPADYSNGDAGTQCATYKPLAEKTLFRYKTNYADGLAAFQSGDYATAETKFKNVKGGDFFAPAQQRLQEIPALKQKAIDAANNGAQAERDNKNKLDAGTNFFNTGNIDAAKNALNGVTGPHQSDAQQILTKIRNYEAAIAKGQAFESARDFQAAKNAYAEAVSINPVGPATSLMAKAATAATAPPPTNAVNNPPTNIVKPPVQKPQIDVADYIDQGKKALAKNDFKKARRFFSDVLVQDRNNQDAKDGLAEITSKNTASAKASDDDPLLLDIVKTYYAGSYQDAEDRLKVYIYNNQGSKKGLANFYLGASMLTRYYLSGGNDDTLRREAKNKFKAAKDVEGFKAPDKFVSPKIMKVFEEAS